MKSVIYPLTTHVYLKFKMCQTIIFNMRKSSFSLVSDKLKTQKSNSNSLWYIGYQIKSNTNILISYVVLFMKRKCNVFLADASLTFKKGESIIKKVYTCQNPLTNIKNSWNNIEQTDQLLYEVSFYRTCAFSEKNHNSSTRF